MTQSRPAIPLIPILAILLYVSCATSAPMHEAHAACGNGAPSNATLEAKQAFEQNRGVIERRFALADALISDSCFDEAVHLLEEAESTNARNSELQSRLRTARSMLSEQQYFEGLGRAEEAAKVTRNLLRCSRLADLNACDDALALKPDDQQILVAKADALVQAKRPGDALTIYRRVAELAPSNDAIAAKGAAAESQRQAFLATCQSANADAGLQACQSALLVGAGDEFLVHKRKAMLLQAANQPAQALDSYIAANLLKRDDKAVALAIVALSDSTGRQDALTLAAQGSALLTLGRATDAVSSLRQALTLAPTLPDLKSQLANAERLAQVEARRRANAAASTDSSSVKETLAASTATQAPARRYSNAAPPTRSN